MSVVGRASSPARSTASSSIGWWPATSASWGVQVDENVLDATVANPPLVEDVLAAYVTWPTPAPPTAPPRPACGSATPPPFAVSRPTTAPGKVSGAALLPRTRCSRTYAPTTTRSASTSSTSTRTRRSARLTGRSQRSDRRHVRVGRPGLGLSSPAVQGHADRAELVRHQARRRQARRGHEARTTIRSSTFVNQCWAAHRQLQGRRQPLGHERQRLQRHEAWRGGCLY